ncbi:MAG: tyrosine-type recombinase/integrase [Flavobacteriales bacterium]
MDILLYDLSRFPDTFIGQIDRLVIKLFYATEIRKSKLINLHLTDINVNNERIKMLGKGKRIIPILSSLGKDILAYIAQRASIATPSNSYHIVTKKGKKLYEKLIYSVVDTYLRLISTKIKKSLHILRHTFAIRLLDHGTNLNTVKEILSHSTLASTQI